MTNKGHFKEEIFEIACSGDTVAVDLNGQPCCCGETRCWNCLFDKDSRQCSELLAEWLNSEYVEPCEFEKDELVEVSDDEWYWYLEYFVEFTEGMYKARVHKEDEMISGWKYCRKYGTLGGLEKHISKKPLMRYENMGLGISPNERFKVYGCPCCKEEIDEETSFCQNCGQKIDWKGEQ